MCLGFWQPRNMIVNKGQLQGIFSIFGSQAQKYLSRMKDVLYSSSQMTLKQELHFFSLDISWPDQHASNKQGSRSLPLS